MDSNLTNAITDTILAIYVFLCIVHASWKNVEGNKKYSMFIIAFLAALFVSLSLGALSHFFPNNPVYEKSFKLGFGYSVILVNYTLVNAIKIPDSMRLLSVIFSLIFIYLNNIYMDYIFVAISLLLTFLIAAYYSHGYARLGLVGIIVSNILVILVRMAINAYLGYELPKGYRYDNDIYHLLLVLSFYFLYKSISRGEWSYPK